MSDLSNTKYILLESAKTTKRLHGIDPTKPMNIRQVLVDDRAFKTYVNSLAESILDEGVRRDFKVLAENTRVKLLENSMYQINPYETLSLPILRVFYPKLIAKEAVTVTPIDKPRVVKAFIRPKFVTYGSSTQYAAPSITTDISGGPRVGTPVSATIPVPSTDYDILATQGLTKDQVHLEPDFTINGIYDGTSWVSTVIKPALEGHFSSHVSTPAGDDVITGKVNYKDGLVSIASTSGLISSVRYTVSMSLEEYRINPSVVLEIDKISLDTKDRTISARWTINLEQDMRALFDLSIQAEMVNILGQQIALDIDREIISELINWNNVLNSSSHRGQFRRTPPDNYLLGEKLWHDNIVPVLNQLSAQIYADTNMEAGNTILANPLDVAILEDIQGFNYVGTSSIDGEMGYKTAVVSGGKWKVLTSAVVPEGTMIIVYKPAEELRSVFIYAPYTPAVISPFPLGSTPTLTIQSRYAAAIIRPAGVATLSVI